MPKSHTELIHCDNCGEDFAATYRRCPFCNAKPGQRAPKDDAVDYHEPAEPVEYEPAYDTRPIFRNGGGKRLAGGGGGGGGGYRQRRNGPPIGKILLYVGTALVILAAVWIITVKVLPRFFPAQSSVEPSPSPTEAVTPTPVPPSPSVEPTEAVTPTPDVTPTDPVAVTDAPAPSPSVSAAPSALTLSSVDFTLSPKWPTYQMKVTGATGKVTYSIGSPSVATVSDSGLVTAVANGWTVLTVTDEAGATAKCDVRVAGMAKADPPAATDNGGSSGNSGSSGGTSSSGAKLSTEDFTLSQKLGYTAQLSVRGGTAVGWSSSDESVATVSGSGLVTGVSKGTATITCTLSDGSKLTSIARVY